MFRRLSSLFILAALLALSTGCRSTCNGSRGWFSSNSNSQAPCHLTGNSNGMEGCFDPVSGRPIPCPPMDSSVVIPGGTPSPGFAPRSDELPYPAPSDMIPRPGVPYAPPAPAPGGMGASTTPKTGTTVKGTKQ